MALTNKLTAIGNAIRAKNGETALYTLDEMPQKIAAIEGGGGSGSSILPSEYKEVEFLQVDGSQYIITDYYPTGYTQIIVNSYAHLNAGYIYGVRNTNDTASFTYMTRTTGYANNCRYGSLTMLNTNSSVPIYFYYGYNSINSEASLVIYDHIKGNISFNQTYSSTQEFTSTLPLYIFNCNQNGAATSNGIIGNLYRLTIKENGIIVRDFIPCYRKSDSKPGLYDIVNKQFYTNAGSGEFSFPEYTIQEVNNETANF